MKRIALALLAALPLFAATPHNDDSCDVAVLPAATLLLPYFEVDPHDRNGEQTLFTVTNVTHHEQVAHVTLWTDRAYPVVDFDVFLTGYDLQTINLYDVIALGQIAPPRGTGFHHPGSPEGDFSQDDANPAVDEQSCRNLPVDLGPELRERIRRAFTQGVAGECARVGGVHANAIGYATIDVVRRCNAPNAQEPGFVDALLFDNVLTGEYRQLNGAANIAQSAPLVHIRAIPEGGGATALPETFYSAFQSGRNRTRDLRQPLPSAFAAQVANGTSLKVWRAGETGAVRACDVYTINAELPVIEAVYFDDDGNALPYAGELPEAATSLVATRDGAGWTYLNLGGQAWVISSTRGEGAFDVEATALANGCSPALEAGAEIGPAPNFNAAAAIAPPVTNNDDSCDIAVLPAATLLLPYFETTPDWPEGPRTAFTVTNVTASQRVAHVTIWTDHAWPIFSFDLLLGGYDTQRVDLYDVLALGRIPSSCGGIPSELPQELRTRIRNALTFGRLAATADQPACNVAGSTGHPSNAAVGYVTVDVMNTCTLLDATQPEYWDAIAFDNVLTGDYQYSYADEAWAQGAPLVHIRAVPEDGRAAPFLRTFYSRFQPLANPTRDARQPLPSVFATRFVDRGAGQFQTSVNVWREGVTGPGANCSRSIENVTLFAELATFDDRENGLGYVPEQCPVTCIDEEDRLEAAGTYRYGDGHFLFPQIADAESGWLYLNLANDLGDDYPSQSWVTTTLRANGRYAVVSEATAFGNGCTPITDRSELHLGSHRIGPAPNRNEP